MLSDLVLDTNVLLHASNPYSLEFGASSGFLEKLLYLPTILCVEEGFSTDRARNRSIIMGEYFDNLRQGTVGYEFILSLASSARINGVKKQVNPREAKIIIQKVTDKSDRIFVKVALNTKEQILVSHDFKHFPDTVRSFLEDAIEVHITDCDNCCLD
jgi:hypothetical protein